MLEKLLKRVHIEPIIEKTSEITKDDAKIIYDKMDVLMKVLTASSVTELEVKTAIKKEYVVSETMAKAPSKPSLIFP